VYGRKPIVGDLAFDTEGTTTDGVENVTPDGPPPTGIEGDAPLDLNDGTRISLSRGDLAANVHSFLFF
jgi:hypothetical protein